MATPQYKTFHPKTRKAWRQWLQENEAISPGVWMIYYKKETGKRHFSYEEAVEEALCFGWIDSSPKKLDEEKAMLKFTPRKAKSVWSKLNKKRIEELINKGLMTAAGFLKIEQAKKNGSWETLSVSDAYADNNTLPPDLAKAFTKNKKALRNFTAFPTGYRRQFLFWIDSAKRPETRKIRIQQTIKMASANKKPGPNGFKL